MRPVKHSGLIIEVHCDTGPCPFLHLSPEPLQKGFDITPLEIPEYGLGKDGLQGSSLLPVHGVIIAFIAITDNLASERVEGD